MQLPSTGGAEVVVGGGGGGGGGGAMHDCTMAMTRLARQTVTNMVLRQTQILSLQKSFIDMKESKESCRMFIIR